MGPAKTIILVPLLLAACSSVVQLGRDFDPAAFDAKVQPGVTTQSDVRSWLGAPTGVGVSVEASGERYDKWTYYHAEGEFPGMKSTRMKFLEIKFDRQHIVRAYNWSGDQK
jgi:hypothetical protein